MANGLTFEQVKKARVFAWHDLHYIFTDDTLLRVVLPVDLDSGASVPDRLPMTIRPSSLRGSEHLLDNGWHHLDGCSCHYCAPHKGRAERGVDCHDRCGGPAQRD